MKSGKKPGNTGVLKRDEVEMKLTWNLKDIYGSEEDFLKDQDKAISLIKEFLEKYKGKIKDGKTVVEALKEYEILLEILSKTSHYVDLHMAEDRTNPLNQKRYGEFTSKVSGLSSELSFLETDLLSLSEEELKAAVDLDPTLNIFIDDLKRKKEHLLDPNTEKVLGNLGEVMNLPYTIYETSKLADMTFPEFEVKGKKYPLSFINFEGEYEYDENHEVRREAFRVFSDTLKKYKYTIGTAYYTQLRKEKILSGLRNYDSVFTYLLDRQKVDMELYNRQLDVIMEELAPHMRKYASLIKKIHKLDKMTYADLKLDIDPEFEPTISVEDSKEYIYESLKVLGEDYHEMLKTAMDERWVDFVQNVGKSTGGFCTAPLGVHPYILMSWTYKMREVFVLAHELGHAGHDVLTTKNQRVLNGNLSMYAIEAPSTMNEMLMGNYLMKKADNVRFKRWVVSSIIARTYFHNFVTHFLEGYYQREVYRLIDKGEALSTDDFSRLYKETLTKFWGEEVELVDGAELTWMRQPHYYMGLYPYTYSAGLTIATSVARRILKEGQTAVDDWRECLKAGGTVTPVEFAKLAKVDITTDAPLKETISYIGSLIDDIENLTEELVKEEKNKKEVKEVKSEKKLKKDKEKPEKKVKEKKEKPVKKEKENKTKEKKDTKKKSDSKEKAVTVKGVLKKK